MAKQLHVNGACPIFVGTGGAGALEELGISVEGVEISINEYFDDVFTDHYGSKVPYDVQYFLQDATIKFDLVLYDLDVLNKCLSAVPGAGITEGTIWKAGDLMLTNSLSTRLLIKSTPSGTGLTTVEPCYNFPKAFPIDSSSTTLGTRKTVWTMTWRALNSQNAASSVGQVLWNDTCV